MPAMVKAHGAWLALGLSLAGPAVAEIVATCGASEGYGYYPPGAVVKEKDAGWTQDAISKGSFQLIRSGDSWDIIFTDASGGTLSAKGDGGEVLGLPTPAGDVVVHVVYERNVETYIFWLSLKEPLVTFSQAKFATTIPKHSLLKAACKLGVR